jgi:hypothetical protein
MKRQKKRSEQQSLPIASKSKSAPQGHTQASEDNIAHEGVSLQECFQSFFDTLKPQINLTELTEEGIRIPRIVLENEFYLQLPF